MYWNKLSWKSYFKYIMIHQQWPIHMPDEIQPFIDDRMIFRSMRRKSNIPNKILLPSNSFYKKKVKGTKIQNLLMNCIFIHNSRTRKSSSHLFVNAIVSKLATSYNFLSKIIGWIAMSVKCDQTDNYLK